MTNRFNEFADSALDCAAHRISSAQDDMAVRAKSLRKAVTHQDDPAQKADLAAAADEAEAMAFKLDELFYVIQQARVNTL